MFTILGGDKAPPTAPFNGILCAQRATRKRTSKTERIESSSLRVIEDVASLVVRHRMNVYTHEKYTYTHNVYIGGDDDDKVNYLATNSNKNCATSGESGT